MRGYEYIKFSKGTAQVNPGMIYDAYEKLIKSIRKNIRSLDSDLFKVTVQSDSNFARRVAEKSRINQARGWKDTVTLTISAKVIVDLHKQVMNRFSKQLEENKKVEKIEAELERFQNQFMNDK